MSDKRIPGVPTIGNIQDPEVRKALQALSDGWRVRNGETKDVGSQFVTRDDLERYLQSGSWQGGSGVGGGAQLATGQMARGGIGQAFRGLVQSIIAEIQSSVLWQRLSSRIDALDGPNGVLHRIGLTESGIKRFESQTNNKIEVIEGILVQPDGTTLAAIVEERVAEMADGLARTLNQTTLQTMANGGSVLAQEALQISQPSSVEGRLDVSWTVKFDVDGYVVGAGLGLEGKDGNYTSQFLVRADRFAVGSPTTADVFPFIVDSRPGGSVIALNGQVYIGAKTADEIAANAAVPAVNSIGAFASPPSTTGLKKNSVYRNTTDGNVYILTTDGGSWSLWIEKGAPGQSGTPGSSGTRGSMTLYASGSSWSDTAANNAITNATGSSTRVIGDTVTISNGSSFAATRYWSGSSWLNPGVVIDGNLLVSGTVSASKFNAGSGSTGVSIAGDVPVTNAVGAQITNGVYVYQNSYTMYGLYCKNIYGSGVSYTTTGGGAAYFESVGGFTVDSYNNALPYNGIVTNVRAISGRSEYGVGVLGLTGSSNGIGVYGQGVGSGYAGYFNGNLHVTGNITCGGTYPGGVGGGVTSFNSRTGAVNLSSGDVTSALGFTPVSSSGSVNYANSAGSASSATWATASGGSVYLQSGSYTLKFQSADNNLIYKNGSTALWSAMTGWISDARFKDVYGNTSAVGLDIVNALRVVDYRFKTDGPVADGGIKWTGFLAQEVAEVVPSLVSDTGSSLLLNKVEIIPFLVKAVQELSLEVALLKTKVSGT